MGHRASTAIVVLRAPSVLATMVTALIALMLHGAATAPPATGAEVTDETSFVERTNALRASLGLAPFAVDPELTAVARRWSEQMAADGDIWHNPGLAGDVTASRWWKLNENVGTGPGVAPIHDAFAASPGHRANLVNPHYTHVGVGVVRVGNVRYVTQIFAQAATPRAGTRTSATDPNGHAASTRPAARPTGATAAPAPPPRPRPMSDRLRFVLDQVRALGV